MSSYTSLCQDCGRVTGSEQLQPDGDWLTCRCGGETCGCPGCLADLAALGAGRFDNAGFRSTILAWSAEGGAVFSKRETSTEESR